MVDYVHAWKVRMIQLIVVNVIFFIIGICTAIGNKDVLNGVMIWILGAWACGTLISSFTKGGDKMSSLAKNCLSSMVLGIFAAGSGGSSLWIFLFMFRLIKAMIGLVVVAILLLVEFILYPITTIYYFVRSRQ